MILRWKKAAIRCVLALCLLDILTIADAGKCSYDVGKSKFQISDWTWQIPAGHTLYTISFCKPISDCAGANICKVDANGKKQSLGKKSNSTTALASDGSGFTTSFQGDGKCASQSYKAEVYFVCGKVLGVPEFVEANGCTYIFEFTTVEACKKPSVAKEIPCAVVDSNKKLRDLSLLVKAEGGHRVTSPENFYINVCRDITSHSVNGVHCPKGTSSCVNGQDKGHIVEFSSLQMINDYTINLKYANKSNGCSTNITFVCPNAVSRPGGSGPILQSSLGCHYEILWETEHACPVADQVSSTCNITTQDGYFDLSPLKRNPDHYHKVVYQDKNTKYTYFMNICGPMKNFPCNKKADVAVCQTSSTVAKKAGDGKHMKLRYVDGQIILTYTNGEACHSGLRRSTIITFTCDDHAGDGSPSFNHEDHCNYFFDWPTSLVCPRARKTGDGCRVITSHNQVYDLAELVKSGKENWHAVDTTSNKLDGIYLNVCGSINASPITKNCPADNAACLISGSSYIGLGKFESPLINDAANSLRLVYTNGTLCDVTNRKRRRSFITLVCHPGQLSMPPTLVSRSPDDCDYQFVWQTAAACPLGKKIGTGCQVSDPVAGYSFDLTPLSKARPVAGKDYFSQLDSKKEYEYQIKVCDGSIQTRCTTDGKKSVGACQYKSSNGMAKTIGEANSNLVYFDGLLKLRYLHGDKCHNGQSRETQITFLCDHNAGIGNPQFEKELSCGMYNFLWYTKHACRSKIVECSVIDPKTKQQYDLSPLSSNNRWVAANGNKRYYISVCKPLLQRPHGCSVLSAVCSANVGAKGKETFLQDLGTVVQSPTVEPNRDLMITYENGAWCDKNKTVTTKIRFICKSDAGEGSPEFNADASDSCNFIFRWETRYACAVNGSSTIDTGNCTVQDPVSKYTFDLSPLRKANSVYQIKNGADNYILNICGSVPASSCNDLPAGQRPGACKLTGMKGKNPVIGVLSQRLKYSMESITLEYSNGDRQDSGYQFKTIITFVCNKNIPIGTPVYDNFADWTFYFKVETALACQSSTVQCRIAGPGNQMYNLETLIKNKGYWTALNRETNKQKHHYFINVCRALNDRPAACPKGAIAACQVDHNSGKHVGHTIGYLANNPEVRNKTLSIKYLNGEYCHHAGKNRSVQIFFHCSSTEGSPVFQTETNECGYIFNWLTPSACPRINTEGAFCRVEDPVFKHVFDFSSIPERVITINNTKLKLRPCGKTDCGDYGACLESGLKLRNIGGVNRMLHLLNGDLYIEYVNDKITTKVRFICDQNEDSPSLTTDLTKKNLFELIRYDIEWKTPAACFPHYKVECSLFINDKDEMYDLSPLSRWDTNWRALIDTDRVGYPVDRKIYINICRNIVKSKDGEAKDCPDEAGICMIRGSQKLNLGVLSRSPYKEGSDIILEYRGGDMCSGKDRYSSKIRISSSGQSGIGEPVLTGVQGCVHEFTWATSAALPINKQKESSGTNCKVLNPVTGNVIDLTPLKMKPEVRIDDGQGGYIMLRICSPFQNQQLKRKCGQNSAVCRMKESNVNYKANMGNFNQTLFYDKVITLKYGDGDTCEGCSKCKRETLITFVCAPEEEDGFPTLMSQVDDCTQVIVWRTKHVCERMVQCTAFGNIKAFDIGSLTKQDGNIEIGSGTSNAKYYINVCKNLVFDKNSPCPAGSAACKVTNEGGKQQSQNLGELSLPPQITSDKKIILTYENGEVCSSDKAKRWKTVISFVCKVGSKGQPSFKGCENCICNFEWQTNEVCNEKEEVDEAKCTVKDDNLNYKFDLSPLKKSKPGNYKVRSKLPGISYILNVCGTSSADDKNCSHSGVCRVETMNGKTIYRSLGLVKYQKLSYDEITKVLVLKYLQDEDGTKSPTAIITFNCNELVDKGQPVLISDVQTSSLRFYSFHWPTSLVCLPAAVPTVVKYNGKDFDLKKLSINGNFVTEDTRYKYVINVFGGVKDRQNGCPRTAAVCRISKVGDEIDVLAPASKQKLSANSTNVIIDYTGGRSSGLSVSLRIVLKCGDDNKISLKPFNRENGTYLFVLNTKSVCIERPPTPPSSKPKATSTAHKRHGAAIAILIILAVLFLVLFVYVMKDPRRRANTASCIRFNFKKYICCKSMEAPGYKYRKVHVQSDESDIEEREGLLIADVDGETHYRDESEDEDTELLQL